MQDFTHWRRSPTAHLSGLWRFRSPGGFQPEELARPWQLLRDGPHSLLFRIGGERARIVKLIRPRSTPRDQLRKYFQAQALREYNGGRYLRGLGLVTPANHAWGISVSPFSRFDSVLVMEQLTDFVSGLAIIRRERDTTVRRHFLTTFATGIAAIYGNGYIHKDCHFENICRLADGRLAWIDTDIRKSNNLKTQQQGLRKTLALLRATARTDVDIDEWQAFMQCLADALAPYPNGSRLSHEIQ